MTNLSDMIKAASIVRSETEQNEEYQTKMKKNIERLNANIERAKENGKSEAPFNVDIDVQQHIRELYSQKGYGFKPTGYIGGVWQLTEDIYW